MSDPTDLMERLDLVRARLEPHEPILAEWATEAADHIKKLTAELERTRQAWVNGEDPMCEDVCLVECKGPCEGREVTP